jgi:hypothetical protein
MTGERTAGPEYYALADGRQLWELERETLAPLLSGLGISVYDVHCVLSAVEHEFRRGAKPGEEVTDAQSRDWWISQASEMGQMAWLVVKPMIREERAKVGR